MKLQQLMDVARTLLYEAVRDEILSSPSKPYATIATTMRYVHPTPEHKRNAMEKLEQFNIDQVFARIQNGESLQKSLQ